ncbi:MAG TPA: PhaM family polyhydroxyalkanoate granule multifunctional regulatory protein [Albitalea sp.]
MADAPAFGKFVPGFDFLQGLVKNAGSALPTIGQWVAPTLDPEELGKRIEELRTVQFWLEQNARMLAATVQALEVQRMTLSTLRNMNVQMDDLTESLKIRMPEPAAQPPAEPAPAAAPEPAPAAEAGDDSPRAKPARKSRQAAAPAAAASGAVDPMQWWGAITKQFTELAASAMKEAGSDAARSMADAMIRQGAEAGGSAPATPPKAEAPARPARKGAGGAARKRAAPKRDAAA